MSDADLWVPASFARGQANGAKEFDPSATERSVVQRPRVSAGNAGYGAGLGGIVWWVASQADLITPWGTNVPLRDRQLRDFVPSENMWASGQAAVAVRNGAFSWYLDGPDSKVRHLQDVFQYSDEGRGWESLIIKLWQDVTGQDKGGFLNVVREGDKPDGEVIALNHLDAAQCFHTGDPRAPVVYLDVKGGWNLLPWWNVLTFAELPTPIERLPGIQLCALSRLFRATTIARNVAVYHEERTGGRQTTAIHMVRGIDEKAIQDASQRTQIMSDAKGLTRMPLPVIVSPIDLEMDVGHDTLELASLPEGFDIEKQNKWYIAQMAMALLADYQDFAPLTSGNLGTATQSETLHLKSKGKGAALFMKQLIHRMNWFVLPSDVEYGFDEQDVEADKALAQVRLLRAERRKIMVDVGELTPEASLQVAYDEGDVSADILKLMQSQPIEGDVTVEDEEIDDSEGEPGDVTVGDDAGTPSGKARHTAKVLHWSAPYSLGKLSWATTATITRDVAAKERQQVSAFLQSRIHEAFTRAADDLYGLGYMDTAGRIKLSGLIGDALHGLEDRFGEEVADIVTQTIEADDLRLVLGRKGVASPPIPFRATERLRVGPRTRVTRTRLMTSRALSKTS